MVAMPNSSVASTHNIATPTSAMRTHSRQPKELKGRMVPLCAFVAFACGPGH